MTDHSDFHIAENMKSVFAVFSDRSFDNWDRVSNLNRNVKDGHFEDAAINAAVPTEKPDQCHLMSWVILSILVCGPLGVSLGFFTAGPEFDFLARLGTALFISIGSICLYLISRSNAWQRMIWRKLWPIKGDKVVLSFVVISVGSAAGILGFIAGFENVHAIVDFMSGLGLTLVVAVVILLAIVGLMWRLFFGESDD